MKFTTFSILAGSEACNARCPFCVSKMTPACGIELKEPEVNWRNFQIAADYAKDSGISAAMLTGKGEPLLFPDQISKYLSALQMARIPLIELQTNGILLAEQEEKYKPYLKEWYDKKLTTVAISIVHYEPEKNREIYVPYRKNYIHLPDLIGTLHEVGFSVRLTCVGLNGYIDSAKKLETLVRYAKRERVEQLTFKGVEKPSDTRNQLVYDWTSEHHLKPQQLEEMINYANTHGTKVLDMPHGGAVYDIDDQNLAMTNCLTKDTDPENLRQLIFFPDGHLRHSWEKAGALIF